MSRQVGEARLLSRGTSVLAVVGKASEPMSFGQIQLATGLAKATLSRILATLRDEGFIAFDRTGKDYVLGPEMLDLLARVETRIVDRVALKNEVQRLADELERPVWYWQVEGDDVRPIEQALPFGMTTDFDTPSRATCRLDKTAAGIAVLAAMEANRLTGVLSRFSETEDPPKGNVSLLLGFSAATGFVTRENGPDSNGGADNTEASREVAAAITDANGVPWSALSVTCRKNEVSDTEAHQIGRRVAFAVQQMSAGPNIGPRKRDVGQRVLQAGGAENRPPAIEKINVEVYDKVGSSPFWDAERRRVIWIDSLGGAINWQAFANMSSGQGEPDAFQGGRLRFDELPGAIVPFQGSGAVVASREGISIVDYEQNRRTVLSHPEKDDALRRFSTAKVGPDGRLWVGTLCPTPVDGFGQGRIYALSRDGSIERVLNLERGPKGICWSPDGSYMYLTEAGSKSILRFEMDVDTGLPVHPRRYARHAGEGTPNGIAMDREGCVWAAIYGGWQVARFDPTGALVDLVDLPVPLPTGLCFFGPKRQDIFVTNCRLHVPPEALLEAPASGAPLRLSTDTQGAPLEDFRLNRG